MKIEKLADLEKQTQAQDFWDDTPKAQGIMRQMTRLREEVVIWQEISNKLAEARELAELADEELRDALLDAAPVPDRRIDRDARELGEFLDRRPGSGIERPAARDHDGPLRLRQHLDGVLDKRSIARALHGDFGR